MTKAIDMVGLKFGRLTVLSRGESVKFQSTTVTTQKCICECGKEVTVFTSNLRTGKTMSCGCLRSDVLKEINSNVRGTHKQINDQDVIDRLENRLVPEPNTGCLLWEGSLSCGYGVMSVGNKLKLVHRLMYEYFAGPIPENLELDHLCRVRCCANVFHLEPVTHKENDLRGVGATAVNARKTHCDRGHEFTKENTYIINGHHRQCKKCWKMRAETYLPKRRERTARRRLSKRNG